MSGLGTTDVGAMFAGAPAASSSAQSRPAALKGVLPPRTHRPSSPAADRAGDETAAREEAQPASPSSASRSRGQRQAQPAPGERGRLAVVYVTQEDLQWVAARRKATDLTNAQIVLLAVEAAAEQLPGVFKIRSQPRRTGMFAATAARTPRPAARHVQLGLNGVGAGDRAVLDRLVADVGAGSLSALVRAALLLARTADGTADAG